MRSWWLGLGLAGVLVALCAFEHEARAEDDEEGGSAGPTGVEIGLRTGFGKIFGKGLKEDDKSSFNGQVPIWLDLGYRITPNVYVGGFFQYGIVLFDAKGCDVDGVSCSAHDLRFGLQGQFAWSNSPPPASTPPPQTENQKPVSGGDAGAWPADVPISERNTCSFVCVPKDGAPPRESDKAALQKSLDKQLGALRACVGNGKSAAGVSVSFDAIGRGSVGYDFGPRAHVRNDCPASLPPVKNLTGPPNASWKCTDYCE